MGGLIEKVETGKETFKNFGVVYIATGPRFVEEAKTSLRSLRMHHPEWPVVLFTDGEGDFCGDGFSDVRRIENPEHSFADKIGPLGASPFEKTLFLDTDTHVCAPLDDLISLLGRVDLAAAHAPMRVTWPQPGIPDAFPEINSGVLAWRKSEGTDAFFAAWERLYREHVATTGQKDDQPALRRALFESNLRLGILPPEYNFRTVLPSFAGRGPVKIIHGRHGDMASIERLVNRSRGCRVVLPGDREWTPGRLVVLSGGIRLLALPVQALAAGWFRLKGVLTGFRRRFFK